MLEVRYLLGMPALYDLLNYFVGTVSLLLHYF